MVRIVLMILFILLQRMLSLEAQEQNMTTLPLAPFFRPVIKSDSNHLLLLPEQELIFIRKRHADAQIWMERKDFDKALLLYNELSHQYAGNSGFREQMITIHANLSNIYLIKNNYKEAMENAIKAVEIVEQIKPKDFKIYSKDENIARLANNISSLMTRLKEHKKALFYLTKAEHAAQRLHQDSMLTTILVNKGSALIDLDRSSEAIAVLKNALKIADRKGLKDIKAVALSHIAHIYTEKKSYALAMSYLEQMEKEIPALQPEMTAQFLLQKGELYFQSGQYAPAEQCLQQCLDIAVKSQNTSLERNAHDALTQLYTHTGAYEKALKHQGSYIKLQDSLYNTSAAHATRELEARYYIVQKDKDLAENLLNLNQQKTSIIYRNIGIGFTTAGLVLFSLLYYSNRRTARGKQRLLQAELESSRQKEDLLQSRNEIAQFRSIMLGEEKERSRLAGELHDGIVSQLSAIKMNLASAIKRNQNTTAPQHDFAVVLKQLSDATEELRRASHNLMPEALVHGGLESALRTFCSRMDASFAGNIHFYVYGELEGMETERQLAVYRMVQELVQNAIKHAEANHIVVQLSSQDSMLGITVEDNGKGFVPTTNTPEGVGWGHLRMKVNALNGKIEVSSSPEGGTSIYIGLDKEQPDSIPLP